MVSQRSLEISQLREQISKLITSEGSVRKVAAQADIHHQTLANFLAGKTQKPHAAVRDKLTRLLQPSQISPFKRPVPLELQRVAERKGLLSADMFRMARAKLKSPSERSERFWEDLAVAIGLVPGIFDT